MDRLDLAEVFSNVRAALRAHGVLVIVVASLTMNVVQDQRLRARSASGSPRPAAGATIPDLHLLGAGAERVTLTAHGAELPAIIYFFSPSCRWCDVNWPSVVELQRLTKGRHRFVAVTTATDVESIIARHHLGFEIYGGLNETERRRIGFGGTPHTIVVSRDGRVLRSWLGAFKGSIQEEIEAYFDLQLPAVAD